MPIRQQARRGRAFFSSHPRSVRCDYGDFFAGTHLESFEWHFFLFLQKTCTRRPPPAKTFRSRQEGRPLFFFPLPLREKIKVVVSLFFFLEISRPPCLKERSRFFFFPTSQWDYPLRPSPRKSMRKDTLIA